MIDLPERIPTFGSGDGNPYVIFRMALAREVTQAGQPLLAVIGEGSFGWRQYDGRLVGFWRDTPTGREPVAGFRIAFRPGAVRAVELEE